MTAMTSTMASASSSCTSCTVARMVTVRSVTVMISTLPGRVCRMRGTSSLTLSATSMTLAPGCRWTERMMAGRNSCSLPAT